MTPQSAPICTTVPYTGGGAALRKAAEFLGAVERRQMRQHPLTRRGRDSALGKAVQGSPWIESARFPKMLNLKDI